MTPAPGTPPAIEPALAPREPVLFGRPVPRATWIERVTCLVGVLAAGVVLFLAARLSPDPRGVGTHEQLGLPACGLVAAWGVPCPSGGFTTTFTLAAHGRPLQAFLNQPFGLLLFCATVLAVPLGLLCLLRGASWVWLLDRLPLGRIAAVGFGLWVLSWAYKWWRMSA